MKYRLAAISLVAGVFCMGTAHAQAIGITASIGTPGAGVHLSVPLAPHLSSRIGFNYASLSTTETISDVDYDVKLSGRTFDALLDYFPAAGTFRITTGIIINGNKATYTAKPRNGSTFTFNGTTYTSSDFGSADGTTDFRDVAPYLGIGWSNGIVRQKGWSFSSDLGIMFQGSPRTTLTAKNCNLGAAACATLDENVKREEAAVNEESRDYRYFPVIRVGAMYKF